MPGSSSLSLAFSPQLTLAELVPGIIRASELLTIPVAVSVHRFSPLDDMLTPFPVRAVTHSPGITASSLAYHICRSPPKTPSQFPVPQKNPACVMQRNATQPSPVSSSNQTGAPRRHDLHVAACTPPSLIPPMASSRGPLASKIAGREPRWAQIFVSRFFPRSGGVQI